jgi:hypothetical protein
MELAIFETEDEQNYVLNMLQKNWKNSLERFTLIGGSKLGASSWYWPATGKKIEYPLKWNPGQPDNAQGVELCLTVMNESNNAQTFTINDAECSTRKVLAEMKFICEKVSKKIDFCSEKCFTKP